VSFRILVAEDEPLMRMHLKEVLEELGYIVTGVAKDGQEALDLIAQEKPDIVILDIKMPGPDGLEVASKVSQQLPVIILTAYTERHLVKRAKDAGVMAYLSKPFRERDISPAIELAVTHFLERSALTDRVSRLKDELETRKVVDHAKSLLMSKEKLDAVVAYRRLQKISMDKNRPMKDVAEAIILMYG
jgi:two-component system, response regulator PdtaR